MTSGNHEQRSKQKELSEQEAKMYFQVYSELEQAVATFSMKNRIGLVLRFSREKLQEDTPQAVMQGLNRAVVWHGGLDISTLIEQELNRDTTRHPSRDGTKPGVGQPLTGSKGAPQQPIRNATRPPNGTGPR